MTRALLFALLLATLAGCGLKGMCTNIGSGCPAATPYDPVKPAPEKPEEET